MAVQSLLTKSLDALALAHLKELADLLKKENMHESADIVSRLAQDFTDRRATLLPFAQVAADIIKTGILPIFYAGDPFMDDLDRASKQWRVNPADRELISDLCSKLGYKKRWVAVEWVLYVANRIGRMQGAIGRLYGVWAPYVDESGISGTHPAIGAAYTALNGIED